MGPGLIGVGSILTIVGITTPITFDLGPWGKLWWPDGPFGDRRPRAMKLISVIFSGFGVGLVIVGIVLAARS